MTLVTSATTSSTTSATDSATASLTADYNLFLKLLTTSMQNQDPLDPMDSSEYTQQLVQYSQVEQSIQSNKTLTSMLSTLNLQSLTQSSSMIGQTVELNSDKSALTDTQSAQWNWTSEKTITGLTATILDSKGSTVATQALTVNGTEGTFTWDGTKSDGTKADDGLYQLTLIGKNDAGVEITTTPSASGTVENVQMIDGTPVVTINGAQYPNSIITRITK